MIRIVPSPQDRAEELYDVVSKVFSHGGRYFEFMRCCREGYFGGSSYDWGVSRVAMDGERIVSHIGAWRYRMRVGRARLLTGGIGAVMTHPRYRRRGVVSRVFGSLLRAMRQAGYDFSVLFGLRDFYDRFGYVQAWPGTDVVVRTDELEAPELKFALRQIPKAEVLCGSGAVMRIYNRDNATRTGTAERPIYTLAGGLHSDFRCYALCDSAGRTRGYVVTRGRGGELVVLEAGGLAACGVGQLLAAVKRLAVRAKRYKVRLVTFAYDHPLCQVLRRGNCSVEMHHHRSGGAMAAVISLAGCLAAMGGELTDRLRRSAVKSFKGRLAIGGAREVVVLEIGGGTVRPARGRPRTANRIVGGAEIARLMIGAESPQALAAQGRIRFSGAAVDLAEAIFPKQWPRLCEIDGF